MKIEELTRPERIGGYLVALTKLAFLGAKLRKNNRADKSWTQEENDEWNAICDEIDPWYYALSEEEHAMLDPIELFLSKVTRADNIDHEKEKIKT